jgi:hypothetical protein
MPTSQAYEKALNLHGCTDLGGRSLNILHVNKLKVRSLDARASVLMWHGSERKDTRGER